jgi:predicted lipoprotein with Yx(FWY)xxD motif
MKRLLTSVTALGVAAVLGAACSSGGGGHSTAASTTGATVSVANVNGVGSVLVDARGQALYVSDQEASGMVLCTGPCNSFWKPLAPGADGTPSGAVTGTSLGVIDRPDGTKQVTADGRPLYTFTEDSPGKVTGNGFSDDFGSQHFTWHAVTAQGASSAPAPSSGTSGYGY